CLNSILLFFISYLNVNRRIQFMLWIKNLILIYKWSTKVFTMFSICFINFFIKMFGYLRQYLNGNFYISIIIFFEKVFLYLIIDNETSITCNFHLLVAHSIYGVPLAEWVIK